MPFLSSNTSQGAFETRKDVITIGTLKYGNTSSTNYLTGGGSTNTSYAKIGQVSGLYKGATIKVTTPSLNRLVG